VLFNFIVLPQKNIFMISSKDLEKVWFLYQTEGAPKGISINSICLQRGVPYNEFDKWFRKTHRSLAPVEVTGMPEVETPAEVNTASQSLTRHPTASHPKGGILVTIKTRDGLQVVKDGLDYEGLKLLVERLEGLC
jgi:hypothetical protein